MLHRSMLVRAVVAAAALALPASAGAIPVPAGAPVVAGPTAGGASVTAFVHGDQLCTVVKAPESPPQPRQLIAIGGSDGARCDAIPVLAPLDVTDDLAETTSSADFATGATGTDVATVQLRAAGKVVAETATKPSPLSGVASELRFYALEAPAGSEPDEVAFLDASGTVRRARDAGDSWAALTAPPQAVTHGRRGSARWSLRSFVARPIASTPLQPERRVALPCVNLEWATGGESAVTSECDAVGREGQQVLPLEGEGCGPIGLYAGAIVRPGVRRLVAVLGDGTRRTVPLGAVHGLETSGTRAGAVVLGAAVAVRRLVAYGAGDRPVESDALRMGPAAPRRCAKAGRSGSTLTDVIDSGPALARTPLAAGPHHVVAADAGALICWAIDHTPKSPAECGPAPVAVADAWLLAQPTVDGRYVAGLVPPAVAFARITLDDGSTRDLAATPIPGYAGQYAQTVNVVAGDVPGPHRAIEYQLRDAGGRVLRHAYGPDGTRLRFVRTLARIHGLPAVTLSTVEGAAAGADLNGQTCLAFGRPPADDDSDCWSVGPDVAAIEADCSTRRIVITTVLAHRGDTLSVRLADGREVRGHVIPLPADLRRFAAAAAVVVLGPHDAPRTLIRRGWSPLRVARVLPPGARQCGYETYALLTSG